MIDELPKLAMPDWLTRPKSEEDMQRQPFPLEGILKDSLYYPAAGLDGDPVKHLAGNIYSFLYVDYAIGKKKLKEEVQNRGFLGYHVLGCRAVRERELTPNGWVPVPPKPGDGNPFEHRELFSEPYCLWYVFDRDPDRGESHGPRRFSLLYLCADGVAAYQALYHSNQQHPLAVAVIQPGTGFGLNWTDFRDRDKIFARTVLDGPVAHPQWLLYGGMVGPDGYPQACWPVEYPNLVRYLDVGTNKIIGIWARD